MSDISIHLYGVITLFVFLLTALILAVCGGMCLLIAAIRSSGREKGLERHSAFGFFLVSTPLIILNVALFGVLLYVIDSNSDDLNQLLDTIAIYAWLPVQAIAWIVAGLVLNKLRK